MKRLAFGCAIVGLLCLTLPAHGEPQREITILNSPLPQGGNGTWGVREVINYKDEFNTLAPIDHIDVAVQAISWDSNSTSATNRVDYQAPKINIYDSGSDGHYENNDPFGVVTDGKVAAGAVEDLSLVASGKLQIPATGIYSFGVSSDDGFELSIDGNLLIEFAGTRGTGDTIGAVELTAGVHDIRVVYFERGGGASVEVFAAEGDKTAFDDKFRLIGHKASGETNTFNVPGLFGDATVTASTAGGSAINTIADGEADLALGNNFTDTYPSINFADPEQGDSDYFPNDVPFPNDTPAQDDDFGVEVEAMLEIPAAGTYRLGYRGDDGSKMRIVGQTFDTIVTDSAGAAVIDGEWLTTDAITADGNTQALIDLVAGTYELEAVFFERGGEANFEIFGADFNDPVNRLLVNGGAQIITVTDDIDGLQLVGEDGVLGDVNGDGVVNGLDVDPFVDVLLNGPYDAAADMNGDEAVNGLDVDPFVAAVLGGGTAAVPEPSTMILVAFAALALVGFGRRRTR